MNDLINRSMSISEISTVLGVTEKTIRKYVNRIFPGKMIHGKVTYFDEKEVTAIKIELGQNQHLDRSVSLPKTDLEKKLLIQQAMGFLNEEIEELRQKVELQSRELTDAQPKIEFHDQVGDSEGLYTIGEAAKTLGFGRNTLFKMLREAKIFFRREPYQKYINQGYFEVKTTVNNEYIQKQSFVTPKGLIWLQKSFG